MRGKYFTDRDRFLFTVAADEPGQEFPNSAERGKTAHAFRPFTNKPPGAGLGASLPHPTVGCHLSRYCVPARGHQCTEGRGYGSEEL